METAPIGFTKGEYDLLVADAEAGKQRSKTCVGTTTAASTADQPWTIRSWIIGPIY